MANARITPLWTDGGSIFYHDSAENHTTWSPPRGYIIPWEVLAKQPWTEHETEGGRVMWLNNKTDQWTTRIPEVYVAFSKARAAPPGHITLVNGVHLVSPNHPGPAAQTSHTHVPAEAYDEDELVRQAIKLSLLDGPKEGASEEKAAHPPIEPGGVRFNPTESIGVCYSCFDEVGTTRMPCNHEYCADCIATLFIQALEADTFEQPSCCGAHLPMDLAGPILGEIGITTTPTPKKSKPKSAPSRPTSSKQRNPRPKVSGSASAGKRPAGATHAGKVDCFICMTDHPIDRVLQAPCNHYYCHPCLKHHFVAATTDETLYPPKCCEREIPITLANLVLSVSELQKFNSKRVEFRTKNKLYCWYPRCSAFIEPTNVAGEVGECKRCRRRTCIHCKNAWHQGECPEDKNSQEVLNMAKRSGWKRCYSCHAMLELADGCNHITCKCGAEFCYICGRRWKTCRCADWDPNNLARRMREVQEANEAGVEYREPPPPPAWGARPPPARPAAPFHYQAYPVVVPAQFNYQWYLPEPLPPPPAPLALDYQWLRPLQPPPPGFPHRGEFFWF